MDDGGRRSSGGGEISILKLGGGIIGRGIFVLWLIFFVIAWASSRTAPQGGQIGVVRSGPALSWVGDWFNGHGISKVIAPGSGSTYIGLGSTVHWYPDDAVQRNYTISADPSQGDQPGVDVVEVSTSDGIRVGINGTFYFTTAFCSPDNPRSCPHGAELVKDFDNRFGVRTFAPDANSSAQLYPWDGNDGWEAFLNTVVRPIIDNDLRQAIGSVTCAQLVASCALVYNHNVKVSSTAGSQNEQTLAAIQARINQTMETDIKNVLGEDYFSNIQFLITGKPSLPTQIQTEIDNAQAQYAAVGSAQAQVQQASLQAEANKLREAGYQNCPACAAIDELKAIPPNVTTFAPGAGFAITK